MWRILQVVVFVVLAGGCGQDAVSSGVPAQGETRPAPQGSSDDLARWARAATMEESSDARRAAMQQLLAAADQGAARSAAAAVLPLLGEARGEVRHRAKQAILDISRRGDALPIAKDLTQHFTDANADVRDAAIDCVVRMSAFGLTEQVVEHLSATAAADNPLQREQVAKALGSIGRVAPQADATLRVLLVDGTPGVRAAAATALGNFGGVSDKVVPALLGAVGDDNDDVAYAALKSLSNIGPPEAVEAMREQLRHKDPRRRELAAAVLWRMAEGAKPALPELESALSDDRAEVRVNVLGALGMLGPPRAEVEEAILNATRDSDPRVRAQAAVALGRVVRVPKTMATLVAMFQDEDAQVRYCAVSWLMTFRDQAGGAIPEVVRMLGDENTKVRHAAEQALTLIGPVKEGEVAALADLLLDPSLEVRAGAKAQLVESAKRGGTRVAAATAVRKLRDAVDQEASENLNAILQEIDAAVVPVKEGRQ